MKLALTELKEKRSFTFSEKEGWLKNVFEQLKLKIEGPLFVHMSLYKQAEDVFVEGRLAVSVILSCARCAKDMTYKIDESFSPVFVLGKETVQDGSVDKGELDVTYFQGEEINLAEVMHEQIVLFLPVQPLCKQDCKGLCSQCGQDLNKKQCGCEREHTQSQFDVLKKLKVKKKGG